MKLIYRIMLSLAAALIPITILWATLFYYAMVGEINDETDDSLDDYATLIIQRCREGRPLPSLNSGSHNSYTIEPATAAEIAAYDGAQYCDRAVYIPEKGETEPARVLTLIFQNSDGRYLKLCVAMPTFEREDLMETVLIWTISLFGLLLLVVVTISILVVRRSLRPLYALLEWLDGYNPGMGVVVVPNDTSITEFRRLNDAAQRAVTRSEELLDRQTQFIGNASHELQTPLAVISNRIEYLMDHTSPSEEQMVELVKIQDTLRHNIRLNRTLLTLTRIESGNIAESSDIDITELVAEIVESLDEVYETRNISCHVEMGPHLCIYMNDAMARMLVTNLIKNAFVYTPQGGNIHITVSSDELCVSNDGDEALDGDRIFDRFYTHTSRQSAVGLGLAIVRSICSYYGFEAKYSFEVSMHIFTVRFNR